MGKKKTKRKVSEIIKYLSTIIWVALLVVLSLLSYKIIRANILPTKYLIIGIAIILLFLFVYGLFLFKKKTNVIVLIILDILSIVVIGGGLYTVPKFDETLDFLKNNLSIQFATNVYNIITSKDSNINSISDLEGKNIYIYKDDKNDDLIKELNKKVSNYKLIEVDDLSKLFTDVIKDDKKIIIVSQGYYDETLLEDNTYEEKIKIIDTIEYKTIVKKNESNKKITEEPFVVYLSGIDTRSGKLPSRSLSDVNIILAVNPKTKKVLMINIPRDYYVQLHGTTGLKDKLTHAGTRGGINLSKESIQDLLDIKVDNYIRVNFNAVVKLVDAIGGIDVYSDTEFNSYHMKGWHVPKGMVHMDGAKALAYSRERYAYKTGDNHRGQNQEDVITAIINKISTSKSIASNYNKILESLDGTFETDLSYDDITSLIKMQLNDMSKWETETCNLTGEGKMTVTYSYPKRNLWVMIPNEKSIVTAKEKLKEFIS